MVERFFPWHIRKNRHIHLLVFVISVNLHCEKSGEFDISIPDFNFVKKSVTAFFVC